ncbi:hypothetical protein E1A91_D05G167700v1 [Gossypium mustelinum]|uniref:Uncharacterized protein n=1 Tax=Gossypium mustelinum TaxID=34275 RepID=A0A5D2UVB5_GOSMU|nr:hypothetical protein E1A91_D05G167700v1 [Gossypium mustelinum]
MEECKLNFNAPLLSVRRLSSTSTFSARDKQKIVANSPSTRAHTLPSEVSWYQVTEAVAVPFVWEQFPGKAKGGIQHEFQPNKEALGTPRLPPGRVLDLIKYPVESEFENQYVLSPQYSMNDNVTKSNCLNEKISGLEKEDDVYLDALDTLSPTDSFSMNCSVSGSIAKPSGTFSTDPQQMSHFLSAAKAMILKTPRSSRKQCTAPEQRREVREVAVGGRKPVNRYELATIPHYNHEPHEEKKEDDYNMYKDSRNLSRAAGGLLARLCFMNFMCLLNPVAGLKVRTRSSLASTCEVAKPGKTTFIKSQSQIVDKHDWAVACNNKSDGRVQSSRFPENKSDAGVQSHRFFEIGKKLLSRWDQCSSSNDLQMVTWLPHKRLPGSARIPSYRRERPQSPFSGGGFLGLPKDAEKFKTNMLVKYTGSNNYSQELVPYQSSKQESYSLSPTDEKTLCLYVDTVKIGSSISNSSNTKTPVDSTGKHSDTIVMNRMLEEAASVESCLQDIKGPNLLDIKGASENEITGPVNSSRSSFSDKSNLRGQADQGEAKGGSADYTPLPVPLPKAPSESWLSRALPAVASKNSFSKSYNGTGFNYPKKQEPKIPATDTKWETIVKTSYLHHDHFRYSEELVTHLSEQSKT